MDMSLGVRVVDLVARGVPTLPVSGCTYRKWNGVVLVELKEEKGDLGLLSQVNGWRFKGFEADMALKSILEKLEKLEAVRDETTKTFQQSLKRTNDVLKGALKSSNNLSKCINGAMKNCIIRAILPLKSCVRSYSSLTKFSV